MNNHLLLVASGSSTNAGHAVFINPGTHYWTCPPGVTRVCVLCVGGGGPGGGALCWRNDIPVVPGETYIVVVGAAGVAQWLSAGAGQPSYFINSNYCYAEGGKTSGSYATYSYNANSAYGGAVGGGYGAPGGYAHSMGGGGAGGYSGHGTNGVQESQSVAQATGGAASGGSSFNSEVSFTDYDPEYGQYYDYYRYYPGAGGGGVALYGQGASGNGRGGGVGAGGDGGSGGAPGQSLPANWRLAGGNGGLYGGGAGAGGYDQWTGEGYSSGAPAGGAVRILWGEGRAFPSTNVGSETN